LVSARYAKGKTPEGRKIMPASKDARLLQPLSFSGVAFERDRAIKDENDASKSVEQEWADRIAEQDAIMSERETEFFTELRARAAI
jgi:hypothetical protein